MAKKSILRQVHLWIACLAILMNALAPSISHAVSYAQGKPPVWEICRADGTRLTIVGDADFARLLGEEKQPPASMAMDEDCDYCLPHAGSFGLPPSVPSGLGDFGNHRLHPFLFYRAPQPLAVWPAARPRGPPATV